jgi:hypothetical protein
VLALSRRLTCGDGERTRPQSYEQSRFLGAFTIGVAPKKWKGIGCRYHLSSAGACTSRYIKYFCTVLSISAQQWSSRSLRVVSFQPLNSANYANPRLAVFFPCLHHYMNEIPVPPQTPVTGPNHSYPNVCKAH